MMRTNMRVAIGLFGLALLVRLVARLLTGYDGLYGQDAFAYLAYSRELRQALATGQPIPPFFWPLGYPLLVALAMLWVGDAPVGGQLISLVTGALIAPLVYLLVQQSDERIGGRGSVLAGVLAGVAAQLLLSSLHVMSDTAALFWATLSAWLLMCSWPERGWMFVLAAVVLATAVLTRWVYGLLALPWAISTLLAWRQARLPWGRQVALAALAVLVGGLLIAAQFALSATQGGLAYTGDLQVVGWNPIYAGQREIVNSDGRFLYEQITAVFYARPAFHPAYIFPLFAPFWLIGLWAMRHRPAHLALLAGWVGSVYLFLVGIPWQNWRFPLALFPPLLTLTGIGLNWSLTRLGRQKQMTLLVVCGLGLVGSLAWAGRDVTHFVRGTAAPKAIARQLAADLPADALVLTFGLTGTMQYYTPLETRELFGLTPADLSAIWPTDRPVYLLLDPTNVTTQWAGKSPALNFTWLQTEAELTEVARFGSFVLWRCQSKG